MSDQTRGATIRVKTLIQSVLAIVLLGLCGLVGFVIGRDGAPMPSYGKNSLQIAAANTTMREPMTLEQCERAATVAMDQTNFEIRPNDRYAKGDDLSVQIYRFKTGVDTPDGHNPYASAVVFCYPKDRQIFSVVADHIYYHHDIITAFTQHLRDNMTQH